jgi:hypothetical protein
MTVIPSESQGIPLRCLRVFATEFFDFAVLRSE